MARKLVHVERDADGKPVAIECSGCGIVKPVSAFSKSNDRKLRHDRAMPCRECKKPKHAAWMRAYRKTVVGKLSSKVSLQRWHDKNPEYERERAHRRWRTDPVYRERVSTAAKRWMREHPEYCRNAESKRRALVRSAGEMTAIDWLCVWEVYGARCAYCGAEDARTIDHVIPLTRGGLHEKENVVPACKSCNSSKGNRPLGAFLLRMGCVADFMRRRTLGLYALKVGA